MAATACVAVASFGLGAASSREARDAERSTVARGRPVLAAKKRWKYAKCFGLIPFSGQRSYQPGCYGQDEPALDPTSGVAGTGQDITWTFKLPRSVYGRSLPDLGPTFWIGTALSDASSFADSAFSELQFYPDSTLAPQGGSNINTGCDPSGYDTNHTRGTWAICDYTWGLYPTGLGYTESAAYVSVVDEFSDPHRPLYLHSGNRIRVHIFDSGDKRHDAEQVITDLTTHRSGLLVMYSNARTGAGSSANPGVGDGALTLPFSTDSTNNSMPWGVVDGTPFAFSWEIGHPNLFQHPGQDVCVPGQWDCWSYNTTDRGWGAIDPVQIQSVTFDVKGKIIKPSGWEANDSEGGVAEDAQWCGAFATPGTEKCSFPYYTYDPRYHAILFGTTYPGTSSTYSYGGAPYEYAESAVCPGPLTTAYNFYYFCDTTLYPPPPIP